MDLTLERPFDTNGNFCIFTVIMENFNNFEVWRFEVTRNLNRLCDKWMNHQITSNCNGIPGNQPTCESSAAG